MTDQFVELLEEELRSGFFTGAQLFISHLGAVVCDVAVGESVPGTEISTSTYFNLHCATKPIVAMTTARCLEERGLDETARVSSLLHIGTSDLTIRDLCSHQAGLREPDAFEYHTASMWSRLEMLAPEKILARGAVGKIEYSEIAAWFLLKCVIETLTERSADDVIAEDLALLCDGDIWFSANPDDRERIDGVGCYVDLATGLPLLHDRISRFWAPAPPAAEGGFASISGLGRWYASVHRALKGEEVSGLPSPAMVRRWASTNRKDKNDPVLGRTCDFALGFMSNLNTHRFGTRPSSGAFGHSGFLGNSFAWADPECDLVVAAFRNGITGDPRKNVEQIRPILIAQIYDELGLTASGASDGV